ncbi:RNA polymerase sigma factor (sigma-70 family) [Chitinophaga skermanii]|uniref:RNA polymerase sigma factor (Sigma-70 family) n=1 Tax=Chitinophaga skermanii TaxID=331697 RepID=A0A327QMT5_9BACT|nr:sigma-70 family RNA polymerase sigma factor [Chitinophaga skermanii]RAJ05185.1 RNA polymerase sigma factor (sigma-70 family) [Chitinophaga skermanii]
MDAAALWIEMKNGDQQAFMEIYNSYYQALYSFGCRIHAHPQLVKDSIHEVFCEVWAGRQSLPTVQQPLSYLFTYLKRKILKEVKVSAITTGEVTAAEGIEQSYEEMIVRAEHDAEMQYKLHNFMRQLSVTQQAILRLKYYENLNYEQIAQQLQLQPRTVYNKLYEALKLMRKSLRVLVLLAPLNFF